MGQQDIHTYVPTYPSHFHKSKKVKMRLNTVNQSYDYYSYRGPFLSSPLAPRGELGPQG
jgi:hypothetical protein